MKKSVGLVNCHHYQMRQKERLGGIIKDTFCCAHNKKSNEYIYKRHMRFSYFEGISAQD